MITARIRRAPWTSRADSTIRASRVGDLTGGLLSSCGRDPVQVFCRINPNACRYPTIRAQPNLRPGLTGGLCCCKEAHAYSARLEGPTTGSSSGGGREARTAGAQFLFSLKSGGQHCPPSCVLPLHRSSASFLHRNHEIPRHTDSVCVRPDTARDGDKTGPILRDTLPSCYVFTTALVLRAAGPSTLAD